jgi:hypothetical protein
MTPQDIKRSICQHEQAQLEWEKGLAVVNGNNITISPPALTPIHFNMTQWKGQFDFYNKECALVTVNIQP